MEEICKLIAQRLLQGCMNHQQFANYYDFIGLEGYKLFHEYQFFEQLLGYRKFITYYIELQDKLVLPSSSQSLLSFSIIPDNWYGYMRPDVQVATRRNAVKNGLQKYLHWEVQTLRFLQDMYSQLMQQNFIAIAQFVKKYIKSVQHEIKYAKKELLEIKATDFDLPTIVSKQEHLIKKYGKKMKQLKSRKESDHEST